MVTLRRYKKMVYFTILLLSVSLLLTQRKFFNEILKYFRENLSSRDDFYPNIGVIIEFRSSHLLPETILNVIEHIPSNWPIQLFHGKDNLDFILKSSLKPFIDKRKVILTLMNTSYNKNETNYLLTDANFWLQVRGEKVLLFQIDSIMCPNSTHNVTDFLQYDYVGAPWDISWFLFGETDLVGNGGFSLRTRSKILQLLRALSYDPEYPEDVWYAKNLHKVNASIPSVDIAKTFSVESIFYEHPIAVHRFPMNCDMKKKVLQVCPDAIRILPKLC